MKKLLPLLFIIAALFTGCTKDTSITNTISANDLALINNQLRGTWVFPVSTVTVLDDMGKQALPTQTIASSALLFDGTGNVTVTPDIGSSQMATYTLSSNKGIIYITILTPDGNTTIYKMVTVNDKMLKLNVVQPELYYVNNNPVIYTAYINTVLRKQNSADITGSLVNFTAASDSLFSITLKVLRGTDTLSLDSQTNITSAYTYSYVAKNGDHLLIDILGNTNKTTFAAYYNGIPLGGKFTAKNGEIITTTGWDIPKN